MSIIIGKYKIKHTFLYITHILSEFFPCSFISDNLYVGNSGLEGGINFSTLAVAANTRELK